MSLPKGDRRVGPIASLALGLPVPVLFALYSVYLGAVRPEPGPLRNLASMQAACLACGATALVGFLLLVARAELRTTLSRLRPALRNLLWLNLFTILGPPLYFVAVVLLGAAAANWIDLGATPIITFAIGTLSADVWLRLWRHHRPAARGVLGLKLAALALATVGVTGVAADVLVHETRHGALWVGVLVALLSAVGTAASGHYLSALQQGSHRLSAGALLPLRYTVPALAMAALWALQSQRVGAGALVLPARPVLYVGALLALYVLPNYLYVLVLKRKGLLFSGYLWALLPVFSSLAEWIVVGKEGTSLSPGASLLGGLLILGAAVVDGQADARAVELERQLAVSTSAAA